MRLRLEKGKQKELVEKFKKEKNFTWVELSKFLEIKYGKLKSFFDETSLISKQVYEILDKDKSFLRYVLEEKKEGWGRKIGGLNSKGREKSIKIPQNSVEFAEFYGIMLGDGNSHKTSFYRSRNNKRGTYMIRIVGDSRYDKDYLDRYVRAIIKKLFGIDSHFGKFKKQNAVYIEAHSSELINFLESKEFPPGNKIKNNLGIPFWIKDSNDYLKACLRGLIDTDGSLFRMSKRDYKLIRISFTNHCKRLLKDTREAFITLGFHPSKIISNKQFFISRQGEIHKYLKEVGFSNQKHTNRLRTINSLVV